MTKRVSAKDPTHTGYTARHERQLRKHTRISPIENVNAVPSSGSSLTLPDVTTATMHDVTLTANCTLTFPSAGAGKSFSLRLVQDGTGSRTVTWPAAVKWQGGSAPTLSTSAGAVDAFALACFDGTRWEAFFAGADLS